MQKQPAPTKVLLDCELGSESGRGSPRGSHVAWGQYPYLDKFFPCHYPYKFIPFQTQGSPVYPYNSLRVFDHYPYKFFACHYPYKFFPFQTIKNPVYLLYSEGLGPISLQVLSRWQEWYLEEIKIKSVVVNLGSLLCGSKMVGIKIVKQLLA